jgi:hypothetical protein
MSPQFELRLDRERCAPGDTISGTIHVLEGGRSRSLEVLLNYNEETEDYAAVATSVSSGPLQAGDLATGMSFEFELAFPPDAFPNYRSEHGELYLELEVKSEEFGLDTHARRRIEVAARTAPGRDVAAFQEAGGKGI